jgi:hypothetical protein
LPRRARSEKRKHPAKPVMMNVGGSLGLALLLAPGLWPRPSLPQEAKQLDGRQPRETVQQLRDGRPFARLCLFCIEESWTDDWRPAELLATK